VPSPDACCDALVAKEPTYDTVRLTALLSGFAQRSAISWFLGLPLSNVSLLYCLLAALVVHLANIVTQVAIWSHPKLMIELIGVRPDSPRAANATLTALVLALDAAIIRAIAIGSLGHHLDGWTIWMLALGCSLLQLAVNLFVQLVERAAEAVAQISPR
jgi:hypothetical protein